MRCALPSLLAAALSASPAFGGAWTLTRDHWQSFSTATASQADWSFAPNGDATIPTRFNKILLQNTFEYGPTGYLTLFATPAYVVANVTTPTRQLSHVQNTSIEAGARVMLTAHRFGKLSIQGSYKTAGSFDLSVSAHNDSGRQIELRVLYGTGFEVFGRDAFIDFQIAQRWISHPRPNETPIDVTAGLWLTRDTMVMAQNFNIISAGDASPPYSYYRSHKLEFSVVQRLSQHWSLQSGVFFSPAGQNALVERGVSIALWTQV
ncbi:MAG: hypothetical protein ISS15_03050 [Alphaproteobacteria bacterium]|nr:hypothetical protein [Alphaproteobacteria bacterium]MBL6939095.1 hypothetical protein [Alphaproteobacteria bacterium]MBL7096612.1 hypothetical protein [Alphaproteobacteria bacterium]